MSNLSNWFEKIKKDKRLVDFYMKNGELSQKEYEKTLASLPDDSAGCENLDIDHEFKNDRPPSEGEESKEGEEL